GGEAVDRLLEARLHDRQLRRAFLDEYAVLEQEGARLVRPDRHAGRQRQRGPEQALRQELDAADAHAEQTGGGLAVAQRLPELLDRLRVAVAVERLDVQVVRAERQPLV